MFQGALDIFLHNRQRVGRFGMPPFRPMLAAVSLTSDPPGAISLIAVRISGLVTIWIYPISNDLIAWRYFSWARGPTARVRAPHGALTGPRFLRSRFLRSLLFTLPLFSLPTFFAPAFCAPVFSRPTFFAPYFLRPLLFSLPTLFAPVVQHQN